MTTPRMEQTTYSAYMAIPLSGKVQAEYIWCAQTAHAAVLIALPCIS